MFVTYVEPDGTQSVAILASENPDGKGNLYVFNTGGAIEYVPRIPDKANAFVDDNGKTPHPYYDLPATEKEPDTEVAPY
jgi:hypothetical protein